ncbi:MAG: enoyl-CoA hydratase/isomerase family protein [Chlamydiia bacterium]|nr:enoyl-CoA hydratase/isomerase family protein [Chlamydiia bacterium]
MSDPVIVEKREDGICILRMNRPEHANASTPELCLALAQAVENCNRDESVHVIIITGTGRFFSAGGDIKAMDTRTDMFAGSPNDIRNKYREIIHKVQLSIYRSDIPVIAAVNGASAGAGNDLVAVCDIAIAAEQAKFQETFVSIGLISGDGGSWLLPRVIGRSNAFLMAYTADWFTAEEVQKMGLVHKVVPNESLMDETLALAARINRHPNGAIRATRRLIIEGGESSFEAALDQCASIQGGLHFTDGHRDRLEKLLKKLNMK